jgi:nucleotide-binding universal stress UspA family protein
MRVPAVPGTESEDSMRAAVEREAATVAEHHPEVVGELIVCEGNAATELVDKSKGVDMLVVGSRGLGGVRGLLLGSVSQQSAPHAHCPVMIVPAEERT